MLGTVLIRLRQMAGIKLDQWYAMTLEWLMLCKTIIARGIDLTIHTVQSIINLLVQTLAKLEPLVARCRTIVVALIKQGHSLALQILGLTGLLRQTIAHKIRQLVSLLQNIGH